jgi:hypothetical protein
MDFWTLRLGDNSRVRFARAELGSERRWLLRATEFPFRDDRLPLGLGVPCIFSFTCCFSFSG